MIVLVTGTKDINGKTLSICARDTDVIEGNKKFYALVNGYYDPQNKFRPCFGGAGDIRRRLYEAYIDEYNNLLEKANAQFDKMHMFYQKKLAQQTAEPQQQPVQQSGGLGSQLENLMIKVLAEQSVDKVLEAAKPMLNQHIIETFGVLPQVHEIKTPTTTKQIQGVVHEKFDTVLELVNADIPVFLTGAAGTGKNVICKQIADAMDLEFYFSNAVTQEYKLTGFIDANGTFHETQFYKAFTEGGLFMLDEMDASIPEVLIILNAAIANRYFDFPTGRVEAHEDFRLIAAGNTFGTGADMEYTGRFQLDAASLDRFAVVEINYSEAIENAISQGDSDLVEFIHAFRKAVDRTGMKHLATYRSIERIKKLDGVMELAEAMKISLFKGLSEDDMSILKSEIGLSGNRYYAAMNNLCR